VHDKGTNEGSKRNKQGALTTWRAQRVGQVRTMKDSKWARATHILESTEGGKIKVPKESE